MALSNLTNRFRSQHLVAACLVMVVGLGAVTGCGSTSSKNKLPTTADKRLVTTANRQRDGEQNWDKSGNTPVNADTHFAAGQLAEAQDNQARAVDQYERALEMKSSHADALFRLGVIYTRQKKYDSAIDAWRRYGKATGGTAGSYANLGFCYEVAGRSTEAETAYLMGIKLDPRNAACRVNYGLMLARRGKFNEATLQMQSVLSEAEVHYNLASVYERQGRREQAKVEYKKAVALDPQLHDAQARLDAIE